eukprot:1158443-Pelagomonas_calceolata.AAC.24
MGGCDLSLTTQGLSWLCTAEVMLTWQPGVHGVWTASEKNKLLFEAACPPAVQGFCVAAFRDPTLLTQVNIQVCSQKEELSQ